MNRTNEIVSKIEKMSGTRNPYAIYFDWTKCTAYSIAQSVFFNQQREQEYLNIIKSYNPSDFVILTGLLSETLSEIFFDVLGDVFMKLSCNSSKTGQFYTPYHISQMAASFFEFEKQEIMNEPAAGAGGLIIAVAEKMKKSGINYQKKLKVVAQDLDYVSLYMCYIQLSLYGIDAKVIQCDSLKNEINIDYTKKDVLITPQHLINGGTW